MMRSVPCGNWRIILKMMCYDYNSRKGLSDGADDDSGGGAAVARAYGGNSL